MALSVEEVLQRYVDWCEWRADLCDQEDAYWSGGSVPEDQPDWEDSDDAGCALAHDLAAILSEVLERPLPKPTPKDA